MSSNRGQQGGRFRGDDFRGGRGGPGGPPGRGRGSTPQSSDSFRGGRASPSVRGAPRGRGAQPGDSFDTSGRGGHGGGFVRGPPRGRGGPIIFAQNTPAIIPPRLTDNNHSELIDSFKSMEILPARPLRPGYGTLGNPITLRANFFPLRLPKGPFYDYKFEISPQKDLRTRIKARIFQLLERSPACEPFLTHIAHDSSQRLVSAKKLPQPLDIQVPYYEEPETAPAADSDVYIVSIIFQGDLDISKLTAYMTGAVTSRDYDPLPLVSALNLVLQQHAVRRGAIRLGGKRKKKDGEESMTEGGNKYFFQDTSYKVDLGAGAEAWQGFYSSVRPTFKQLMVNVNVCMAPFIVAGNLADALLSFSRNSFGAMPTLPKSMMRMKVRTRHLGYTKSIKKIGTLSARNTKFDCAEFGGVITVEKYFQKKYNIALKHAADLPIVDIGSPKKVVWVPAELCDIIVGNPYGKLDDKQTAQMIRYACNPPRVNAEAIINQGLPSLGFSPIAGPISGFGITVEPDMANIPGRELRAPKLNYRIGAPNVKDGSWNILDVKFHKGATVQSWWVMAVRDGGGILKGPDDSRLLELVTGFHAKCQRSGMNLPASRPPLIGIALPHPDVDPGRVQALNSIKEKLKENMKSRGRPTFILVLLERRDSFIYPGVKRIGDVELGLHTIHMQLSKALNEPRKQDQYFSNVALKANTKLGGINHLLASGAMEWLTKKKTMMVGIDVTHPGIGSKEGTPSIAAVVASVDDSFVQFPASLRIQASRQEMLDELENMLIERLTLYEKKNKILPQRVFVFRDGVSEGQYDIVLKDELPQILKAFKRFGTKGRKGEYHPQLSIVICGKRHHARLYATDSAYADRNGNTRPGTIVDKGITAVFDFDFYLQAHAGLQGNVKATHYTVVYDENAFSADEIQRGTHDASYLYARATKAVSLIPPAYYADLACERGRCYLNDFLVDDKTSVSGRSRGRDEEKARVFQAAKEAWGEGLHSDMRESMFYI